MPFPNTWMKNSSNEFLAHRSKLNLKSRAAILRLLLKKKTNCTCTGKIQALEELLSKLWKTELDKRSKLSKNPWQVHWCQYWSSHQNQAQGFRWWYDSLGLYFHWKPASIKNYHQLLSMRLFCHVATQRNFCFLHKNGICGRFQNSKCKRSMSPPLALLWFFSRVSEIA